MGDTGANQSAWLARHMALTFSMGIERSFWYMWDSFTWGKLFDRSTKSLLQPGIAHREVYHWMVGANMNPCTSANNVYQCKLSRSGGYEALMVWNTGASSAFSTGTGFTRYKTLSGSVISIESGSVPIGAQPILIEKPGL
jgi:hypothetical protein